MNRDRIVREVTPDIVAALRVFESHGFQSMWHDVGWFVAMKIGQSLRFSNGEAGLYPTVRRLLLQRYHSSPGVLALAATLPTDRRWSATLLAPVIAAYLDLPNAEALRASLPPGAPR